MIFVNYVDTIYNNQVYCAVDIIKNDGNVYYHLLLIKWFGAYDGSLSQGRGEMLALAAINPKFRNENIIIAPSINQKPDEYLHTWRLKYKSLQYVGIQPELRSILTSEVALINEESEISILGKIMAKNLPSVVLTEDDRGISLMLGAETGDLPYDKVVLCLVKQTELSEPKIIGFRRPTSKKHLFEIIKQANEHNLLVYYSSFTISGKEIVAEGPWILLPASLRNFSPTKQSNRFIVDEDLDNFESSKITSEVPQSPAELQLETPQQEKSSEILSPISLDDDKPELVKDDDGLSCPYCDKKLKSLFGLTNHINHKHPDKKEEYERAYKN